MGLHPTGTKPSLVEEVLRALSVYKKLIAISRLYGGYSLFIYTVDNAGNYPTAYHRMDVLPEAKTCYHTDTVSYPGNVPHTDV